MDLLDSNVKRPRRHRWRVDFQKQLGASNLVDIAYNGSFSDHISVNQPLSALPSQYWANGMTRDNTLASDKNANVTNPFYIGNFASLKTSNPLIYRIWPTRASLLHRPSRRTNCCVPIRR